MIFHLNHLKKLKEKLTLKCNEVIKVSCTFINLEINYSYHF